MTVDFGLTSADYARHRQGFPSAFFERIAALGIGLPGQRILDLGTGTGALARPLAQRGAIVTGIDPSAPQIEQARRLAAEQGVEATFLEGRAEATGLPDASFDVVTAAQCWHWFDRAQAAAECRRLLMPGGPVLLAHLDWVNTPGSLVDLTERLAAEYKPDTPQPWNTFGVGVGIYPEWLRDLGVAGFGRFETFSFDVPLLYTHEGWLGRIRASAVAGARKDFADAAEFDERLAGIVRSRFPAEPIPVLHRVWAVIARKPESA